MIRFHKITVLKDPFSIHLLSSIPENIYQLHQNDILSIMQSGPEITIVCSSNVTIDAAINRNDNWRCFKVHGPLDFDEIGIIASITSLLAKKKISVFVISTYSMDFILVKQKDVESAKKVLTDFGHHVNTEQMWPPRTLADMKLPAIDNFFSLKNGF